MKEVLSEYGSLLIGTLGAVAVIRIMERLFFSSQGPLAELILAFLK